MRGRQRLVSGRSEMGLAFTSMASETSAIKHTEKSWQDDLKRGETPSKTPSGRFHAETLMEALYVWGGNKNGCTEPAF